MLSTGRIKAYSGLNSSYSIITNSKAHGGIVLLRHKCLLNSIVPFKVIMLLFILKSRRLLTTPRLNSLTDCRMNLIRGRMNRQMKIIS